MEFMSIALALLIMIFLHEIIHLIVCWILRVRIEALLITWFGIAFFLRDEDVVYSRLKLALTSLSPLILSLPIFMGGMISLISSLNLFASLGDVALFLTFISRSPEERIKLSRGIKTRMRKHAIYLLNF
ncbi:hypothetical protein DRN86_01140 [Candidatus Geothermarchaeota archaeon]|nr:MAG: hypothetical protein DRN86_01140 [Candidatus Geothermarchaeota archaeon]